jgi:hypothetical protein
MHNVDKTANCKFNQITLSWQSNRPRLIPHLLLRLILGDINACSHFNHIDIKLNSL